VAAPTARRGASCLADFPARSPFRFNRAQTDQIVAESAAADADGHVSDSAVQRRAEPVIRGLLAGRLAVPRAPRTIKVATGAPVQVDAAFNDGKGVQVEVVDLPTDLRAEILAAQAGQTMVNPA
jgi:hypothetical protein